MNTLEKNKIQNGRFIPRTYSDLVDGFLKDAFFENKREKFVPSADISEDDKAFYLNVSIPGIDKEAVTLEVNEGVLSVSGEKKQIEEDNTKKYHVIESYYGSFKRSFKLPDNSKQDAIEAEYKNGVLAITIPKQENASLKSKIQIK